MNSPSTKNSPSAHEEEDDMIKVFVRVKPDIKGDKKFPHSENENIIKVQNNKGIYVINQDREIIKNFNFEHVFQEYPKPVSGRILHQFLMTF